MSTQTLLRALKDEDYRLSKNINVTNPVGAIELTDADLGGVSGADGLLSTFPQCPPTTTTTPLYSIVLLCQPTSDPVC
jgi:hypothetical protein